jgi:hypothetical protein
MSNRVPESVDGAGRVDNGWGEETLPLNLADGLSESEVVLFVTAAVQNEQQFHVDADLAKKMVPVRRIVRLVNHGIRVYGFPLSAARLDGF